jgi:hypothetical protein
MDNRTIFECRTCGEGTQGNTDGTTDKPGWMHIENIDGRNHICPECLADPGSLDHLLEEYPNACVEPIEGNQYLKSHLILYMARKQGLRIASVQCVKGTPSDFIGLPDIDA